MGIFGDAGKFPPPQPVAAVNSNISAQGAKAESHATQESTLPKLPKQRAPSWLRPAKQTSKPPISSVMPESLMSIFQANKPIRFNGGKDTGTITVEFHERYRQLHFSYGEWNLKSVTVQLDDDDCIDKIIPRSGGSIAELVEAGALLGSALRSTERQSARFEKPELDHHDSKDFFFIRTLNVNSEFGQTLQSSLEFELNRARTGTPAQATHVGIGPFQLYVCSIGFLYRGTTRSLVSSKKDMASLLIRPKGELIGNDPEYQRILNTSDPDKDTRLSRFLIKHTVYRQENVLTDIALARSKYAEMDARRKGQIADRSSKYFIASLLKQYVPAFDPKDIKPFSTYEHALLKQLNEHGLDEVLSLIRLPLAKLKGMNAAAQIRYLQDGIYGADFLPEQEKYAGRRTFPHNEHLIVSAMGEKGIEDVIGIVVSVYGDADDISDALPPKQLGYMREFQNQYRQLTGVSLPFFAYHPETGKLGSLDSLNALPPAGKPQV